MLDIKGDWADQRPDVRPGGWAFQYNNAYYPDLDDTAVVAMAMDRARRQTPGGDRFQEAIDRAVEWTCGLQSRNGGWAAFDADNTHYYLNNIPFADHGALLDPPSVDVAARCVSLLAQLGETASERMARAIAYLRAEQVKDGSFWGRWGVNYIYGAWSALCALNAVRPISPDEPTVQQGGGLAASHSESGRRLGRKLRQLRSGLCRLSTLALDLVPDRLGLLLGLMAAGQVDHPAVERGIAWLTETQDADGLWPEEFYTGGGFPRVFYLRYHGYRKFFPLWAAAPLPPST